MPGRALVPRGPVFSLYALAVDQAVAGAGVLMGHGALVQGHLNRGALVEPFGLRVTPPRGLRLWAARPGGRPGGRAGAAARVLRWLAASG
jgi:LysR family glycine cleavage system transcriptional activator